MPIFLHELKQNRLSWVIWTAAVAFMLGICVLIYPEMSSQMGELSDMFSNMGSFSAAFGMDQLNFGEFMGYFGVECGNTLGLGGAFFAAILGISALAKEEKEHTAEFLLTHPVCRVQVLTEKLLAILAQLTAFHLTIAALTVGAVLIIGESVDVLPFCLLLLSYWLLQIEIACITFGISACRSQSSLGIGIGIAIGLYFVNLLSNLTEDLEFLKYITPFSYADGASVIGDEAIHLPYLISGMLFAIIGIGIAYLVYPKKDIA